METECKHCGKQILNKGSLTVHEIYYCKSNPERKEKKSNFIEYNRKLKSGEVHRQHKNQYDKAKTTGIPFKLSDESRKKMSESSKKQVWTDEQRIRHSISMRNAVANHPLSYSAHNVCGRTKKIEYNGMKLSGTWELEVAKFLDRKGIKWTNIIEPIGYFWGMKQRRYFPDFYLPDFNLYIEVKGNQTDRDEAKWAMVENLMIVKNDEIRSLKAGIDLEIKANNSYFRKEEEKVFFSLTKSS